jgi:photosystem II stability/assembly factor-like uncharacterized protein
LAVLVNATLAIAQTWSPVGPPGGNVRDLAHDPRNPERVYLGTADGILYRSDDSGVSWSRLNPGFPLRGCSLDEIAIDPRGTVYVGYREVSGSGGGVARSVDGGQSFTLLKGIEGESVRALALSPSNRRVIAAGALTGVFLSRDAGESWKRITPDQADLRNIESLAFDPDDPRVLYAGTWHLAWKTRDGGATWLPIHQGMIDDSDVMTLTVLGADPRILYATACSGIYRSTDAGEHWTKLRGIPFSSRRTRAFALAGIEKLLLAGTTEGLWISDDGGEQWFRSPARDLVVNAVITQADGSILIGTEESGILRSSDQGRTWVASNTGFAERFAIKLLVDPEGRLVVATWGAPRYGGVYMSGGVGRPWMHLWEGLEGRQVLSVALLGGTILAGTDDGIFARTPAGRAWDRVAVRLDGKSVRPRVTELLVLPSGSVLAATPDGVIRSPDGGESWTQPTLANASDISALAVSPRNPNLLVAATRSGVFRSGDGGRSWRRVSLPLDVSMHALSFLPSDDRVVFATTTGGLFRSADRGATWRRVNGGVPHSDLTGIAIRPDGRTLYVSDFTWGGIFRSTDGGATWERMPTDGLGSDRVWAMSIDPVAPDRLLAASSAGGVHMYVPAAATNAHQTQDAKPSR